MRTLKNSLIPTLVVLLAAGVVSGLLWGVSQSRVAETMRRGVGREIAVSSPNIGTTTQDTPKENSPSTRMIINAFLKVTVLMGFPGLVTVTVVTQMKRDKLPRDR